MNSTTSFTLFSSPATHLVKAKPPAIPTPQPTPTPPPTTEDETEDETGTTGRKQKGQESIIDYTGYLAIATLYYSFT